jgi:hypothetical protein
MSEITKGLWLCSWEEAKTLAPKLENPLIVNCTIDLPFINTENSTRIPIHDSPEYANLLSENIHDISKKIQSTLLANQPVIVHCLAGVSRSASTVVGYLMLVYSLSKEQAIAYIRQKRPHALMFRNFENVFDKLS